MCDDFIPPKIYITKNFILLKICTSSRQFGFINLKDCPNNWIRDVIQRAIAALQNIIILAHNNNINENISPNSPTNKVKQEIPERNEMLLSWHNDCGECILGTKEEKPNFRDDEKYHDNKETIVQPETYCKLGHLHLLVEEYYEGNTNLFQSMRDTNIIILTQCL